MKKRNSKAHFGSEIAGTTRGRPSCQRRLFRLPNKKDVNVKVSSRIIKLKGRENDFQCRFETNLAAKQHRDTPPYGKFLARNHCGRTRFNTHVFKKIPFVPFLMEFKSSIEKVLSFNPILDCFVQCTKNCHGNT